MSEGSAIHALDARRPAVRRQPVLLLHDSLIRPSGRRGALFCASGHQALPCRQCLFSCPEPRASVSEFHRNYRTPGSRPGRNRWEQYAHTGAERRV
jgi:hypothetical protein